MPLARPVATAALTTGAYTRYATALYPRRMSPLEAPYLARGPLGGYARTNVHVCTTAYGCPETFLFGCSTSVRWSVTRGGAHRLLTPLLPRGRSLHPFLLARTACTSHSPSSYPALALDRPPRCCIFHFASGGCAPRLRVRFAGVHTSQMYHHRCTEDTERYAQIHEIRGWLKFQENGQRDWMWD
ncbi:hypothetical protein FB451DRAFT_1409254 [Mycena latifolia]|nr:hypothetical protein FB451DRAFT_1409254 [Mycena latifolia]